MKQVAGYPPQYTTCRRCHLPQPLNLLKSHHFVLLIFVSLKPCTGENSVNLFVNEIYHI